MKRYFIPLVLLAFSITALAQSGGTMRTVNTTNELVMRNPQDGNTNVFVRTMPSLKGSIWSFIFGDTTGPDTNHLDSVLYPGLGRWVWNNIGTNYFETLIVSNLVAGGDSLWTNLGGILQPQNLTLPVMITNQLQFGPGTTNVLTRTNGIDLVYTNAGNATYGPGIGVVNAADGTQGYIRAKSRDTLIYGELGVGLVDTLTTGNELVWTQNRLWPVSANSIFGGDGSTSPNYAVGIVKQNTNQVRGYLDPLNPLNYSVTELSQPGTNSPFILNQITAGTAGYSRGFKFQTNGVDLFTITGTGGPSSAANWTAVGATDSSLAGTATATNGFTTAENGTIAFTNDVKLVRDGAANSLALRNGTSAQAFRVYNTWANSGTDYERGVLDWITTPNSFTVGTENGGTGQSRSLQFRQGGTNIFYIDAATGALLWNTDTSRNIGASGANRPMNVYVGNHVFAAGVVESGSSMQVNESGSYARMTRDSTVKGSGAIGGAKFSNSSAVLIPIVDAGTYGGIIRVLTNSALSDFLWIAVANTNAIGGKVVWTLTSTDGTDTQQITGETKFGAVAKLTAVTATLADVQCPAAIAGGGTLTAVIASNTTTNNVLALGVTPTSSLTTTNILFKWRLETPSTYTVNAL